MSIQKKITSNSRIPTVFLGKEGLSGGAPQLAEEEDP